MLADALSRVFAVIKPIHTTVPAPTLQEIRTCQDADSVLTKLHRENPNKYSLIPVGDIHLWCDTTQPQPRIVVPNQIRGAVFQEIHGRDHAVYNQT